MTKEEKLEILVKFIFTILILSFFSFFVGIGLLLSNNIIGCYFILPLLVFILVFVIIQIITSIYSIWKN